MTCCKKKFQGAVAEGDQPERWQGAAGLSNISAEHYWLCPYLLVTNYYGCGVMAMTVI